jgi:RNA polymerase sigma-70 factor (ECF subfamily)
MLETCFNEDILVARAIAGDAEAFGELYRFYREAIYRYILIRVRNATDAEDLTEQVFLKAWEALPAYQQRG